MRSPLDGLKVLDFSHALAGPYCSMLMAQYGASVYKVESASGGDIGRGWGPPFTGEDASFFLSVNGGKRGLSVNLKRSEGIELCLKLIERCDVLLENFRPGTMQRLGLGYETARARNLGLIYCSISGYGQNGPMRDEAAMDLILQASSGLISVTGTPDGEPARCGHSVADTTAGMFALIGVLLALHARERTGAGQFVDVSMYDSMISAMSSNFGSYAGSGVVPKPLGTAFATIVPYRTFATADGRHIALAVGSERLWPPFCRAVGRPDLVSAPEYATNSLRVKNRGVLEPLLAEIFQKETAAYWAERLRAEGVPCSPVRTMDEVFCDAQSTVRQMFAPILTAAGAKFTVTGAPVKLTATSGHVTSRAPLLGEHTREVLAELLELPPVELDRLADSGVIACHAAHARA